MNETAIKLTGNKHELERKQKGNRKKNSKEIEKEIERKQQ